MSALADVDLALGAGEIVGLIGPNGAGKTTLLNVLTGYQRADSGRVVLDGREATRLPAHGFPRRGVVRTFQGVRLFGRLSVRENVEVGALCGGARRRDARHHAATVLKELGLSATTEAPAGTLPYGYERRVALARAIATRPRYLLLDEPVAGLDEVETSELQDTILEVQRRLGCGILVIEHDMKLIMALCARIYVLDHGRTIASGSPAEIRADPAVATAYLGTAEHEHA